MSDTLSVHSHRHAHDEGYALLRSGCGLVSLQPFRALALTGDDRKGWLQGQTTQDLRPLEVGGSTLSCQVSPTGQLEAFYGLWALPDQLVLITATESVEAILNRVQRMVILEDVRAEVLDAELVSVQGPEATRRLGKLLPLPPLDAGTADFEGARVLALRSDRTGSGGWDLVVPRTADRALAALRHEFPEIPLEAFWTASLEAGIPRFGVDTDRKTLPPELGPAFEAATVAYDKGCYTGQEVLQRIHSRGHTNRTWVGLIASQPLDRGWPVTVDGHQERGVVTNAAESPEFGFIGAGYVRNELAFDGTPVRIRGPHGTVEAEVQLMPLLRLG